MWTVTEADTYFRTKQTPSPAWQAYDSDQKQKALWECYLRFLALPWRSEFQAEDTRKNTPAIEAAFFLYLALHSVRDVACLLETPVPLDKPDEPYLLNVVCDLPRSVSARLLPFLDADYLTPRAQRSSTSDTRLARPMAG